MKLLDLSGKLLIEKPLYNRKNIIDLNKLPKGLYILYIKDQFSNTYTEKVLKE